MKADMQFSSRTENTTHTDTPAFSSSGTVQEIPYISVIIPCYNQALFLAEAIESVLAQTYPSFEILVIDDGSMDNTQEVASRYPAVRYIRQPNQGLSAARNTGIRSSRGSFLIFLDADDRLLPRAIENGLNEFKSHPECAFVFGKHRMITRDGQPFQTKLPAQRPPGETDSYAWMLRGNQVGMHATVLYRRSVFSAVGGFNNVLPVCEDYDLYLRITRDFPVAYHDNLIAEYRQHDANMSRDLPRMLSAVLGILRQQQPFIRGNAGYRRMYWRGVRNWTYYYSKQLVLDLYRLLKARAWKPALSALRMPSHLLFQWNSKSIRTGSGLVARQMTSVRSRINRVPVGEVSLGDLRQLAPLGTSTGQAAEPGIARYYQEYFLNRFSEDKGGDVLQIGDGTAYPGWDLSTTTLREMDCLHQSTDLSLDSFDCILLPHTLHFVYEILEGLECCLRILKPGGVLLATLPGICPVNSAMVGYWSFTRKAAQQLFSEIFPEGNVQVEVFGNVLAATACLQQLPASCLSPDDLAFVDERYPVVIGIRSIKPKGQ